MTYVLHTPNQFVKHVSVWSNCIVSCARLFALFGKKAGSKNFFLDKDCNTVRGYITLVAKLKV